MDAYIYVCTLCCKILVIEGDLSQCACGHCRQIIPETQNFAAVYSWRAQATVFIKSLIPSHD